MDAVEPSDLWIDLDHHLFGGGHDITVEVLTDERDQPAELPDSNCLLVLEKRVA